MIPALILPALRGPDIDLAQYRGRPLLIVNTASLCGFTGQYAGLQRLHAEYGARGLVVIAVPSADFGNQEHADPERTRQVCDAQFGLTFPVAARAHVKGPQAAPLFRWLGQEAGLLGRPRWNFYKYVIGRNGRLVRWFSCMTSPESSTVRAAIERALVAT